MPPKRKNTGGSNAGTPAKKSKLPNPGVDGVLVRWEVESSGKWHFYPGSFQHVLSDIYNRGNKEIENSFNDVAVVINFEKMTEKTKKTGWQKRLRCCVQDSSEDYFCWQWKDEKNKWNPYNVSDSIKLEKSHCKKETECSIIAAKRSYTINLKNMEQMNDETQVKQAIKRVKSDAVLLPLPIINPTSTSSKPTAKSSSKVKKETNTDEAGTSKTVILKGKAPVDEECTQKLGKAHVYYEGKDVYDVMLNQTNLQNNNNKYFLIQLLQDDNIKSFSVWFRWGRVGKFGQNNLVACGPDLDEAKDIFMKKFFDKTKNQWSERNKFKKVDGKYDLLKMDYSADGIDETDSIQTNGKHKKEVPDSKLDKRVQDLVNLICDVKAMEEAVLEMKYDARKAPLGKLTSEQIKGGYTALKKIDSLISKKDFGASLVQACNDFYTRVPHDFGMSRPPIINTKEVVRAKIQLLEALGDIQVAIKMLKEGDYNDNPVDRHYKSLHCALKPLDKSHADFQMIEDYLKNTHAATHNTYSMELLDVFVCDKEGEKKNFKDLGNRVLLWHGSRLTNYAGILTRGLQIAPPEAPVTGYMFGKGVYFADMSSKSTNYCFATRTRNVGFALLSEVSLGDQRELLAADYGADRLPAGKHSVKGLGRVAPDPEKEFKMRDGTVVPLGKGKDTGVKNPNGYTLNYNEYVVYDAKQVRMRYLCKVKFNFK